MTREEHLKFCTICQHQKFDAQQGIICSLTERPAEFEGTCPAFNVVPGKEDHSTPFDYPQVLLDVEALRASTGKRFANYIIDTLIVYALVFMTAFGMAVFLEIVFPGYLETVDEDSGGFTLFSYLFALTVFGSYYAFMEGIFGLTIGKLITGTRVVNQEGRLPSFSAILLRTLSRFVPLEPFSFLGSSRGWHDRWTDTWVVTKA
jgi:uncharacterized RDD family membrane protein YckC